MIENMFAHGLAHDTSKLKSPEGAPDNTVHWSVLTLYRKENGHIYLRPLGCMHDIERDCLVRMWILVMELEAEGASRLLYTFHAPVLENEHAECEIAAGIGFSTLDMLLAGTQGTKAKALREKYKKKKLH